MAAGLGFWAAPLTWRAIRPLLALGYRHFCRLRPYLAWLPHPDGRHRCLDERCAVQELKPVPDKHPTFKTKQPRGALINLPRGSGKLIGASLAKGLKLT